MLANLIGTQDGFEVASQVNAKQFMASMGTFCQVRSFIIHPDEIKFLKCLEENKISFDSNCNDHKEFVQLEVKDEDSGDEASGEKTPFLMKS